MKVGEKNLLCDLRKLIIARILIAKRAKKAAFLGTGVRLDHLDSEIKARAAAIIVLGLDVLSELVVKHVMQCNQDFYTFFTAGVSPSGTKYIAMIIAENEVTALRVLRLLDEMDENTTEHHRELGYLFGYPKCCVEYFVSHYYTRGPPYNPLDALPQDLYHLVTNKYPELADLTWYPCPNCKVTAKRLYKLAELAELVRELLSECSGKKIASTAIELYKTNPKFKQEVEVISKNLLKFRKKTGAGGGSENR